ncbi:MAG: lytic transglycosylase domain-containing protein [Myxococcaceae bacterium]
MLKRKNRREAIVLGLLLLALPLVLLNQAITYVGHTRVFPLSPYFLSQKMNALVTYSAHRARCAFTGHPSARPLVIAAERRHHLPRGLLAAVIATESSSEPHRISPTGAMGIAQFMPGTARAMGIHDPFDTGQAIDGSARYLASLLRQFRGNVRFAVAAYNAGPGAVHGAVPRNGETEHYVPRVLSRLKRP